MYKIIQENRSGAVKEQQNDVLSGLIEASEDTTSEYDPLTDRELLSMLSIPVKCEAQVADRTE